MENLKLLSKLCIILLGIGLSIEAILFAYFTYLKTNGNILSKASQMFLKTFPVTSSIVGNVCGVFVFSFVALYIRIIFLNRHR